MTADPDASDALPPDPVEYDSARAQIARAKGLAGAVHRRRPRPRPGGRPRGGAPLRQAAALAMVVGADVRRLRHRHRARPSRPAARRDDRRPPRRRARSTDPPGRSRSTSSSRRSRDLIRIPSINPPPPDAPDGELAGRAPHRGCCSTRPASSPRSSSRCPGRGSVHARLRGDGTGGEPLLLLSHLDVVPAPPERWTHDPFAADLADGYIYGRGAVDMKAMVAMELGVVRLLAAEARAAGLDPARDPIPGLRRDVLFTCTADEEAGGIAGAKWVAEHRPEWLRAAGARQRVRRRVGDGRRPPALPDPGRREGLRRLSHRRPRDVGPRLDAARGQRRRPGRGRHRAPGRPGPDPGDAGHGPLPRARRGRAAAPRRRALLRALSGDDPGRAEAALAAACDPMYARALRALLRDTHQPGRRSTPASSTTSSRATPWSRSTAASCPGRPSRRCAPSSSSGSGPSSPPPARSS